MRHVEHRAPGRIVAHRDSLVEKPGDAAAHVFDGHHQLGGWRLERRVAEKGDSLRGEGRLLRVDDRTYQHNVTDGIRSLSGEFDSQLSAHGMPDDHDRAGAPTIEGLHDERCEVFNRQVTAGLGCAPEAGQVERHDGADLREPHCQAGELAVGEADAVQQQEGGPGARGHAEREHRRRLGVRLDCSL